MTNEIYQVEMVGFATDDPDKGHAWNVIDHTWDVFNGGYGRVVGTVDSEIVAEAIADRMEKDRDRILGVA